MNLDNVKKLPWKKSKDADYLVSGVQFLYVNSETML